MIDVNEIRQHLSANTIHFEMELPSAYCIEPIVTIIDI